MSDVDTDWAIEQLNELKEHIENGWNINIKKFDVESSEEPKPSFSHGNAIGIETVNEVEVTIRYRKRHYVNYI